MMPLEPFSVAVIGAGFSGALLAVHLLRNSRAADRIYLIERRAGFGRGLAYSTRNAGHLLNVRAGNMSAFQDHPDHFVEWLRQREASDVGGRGRSDADTFVSRRLYGTYIRSVLCDELWHGGKGRNLFLVPDDAVALNEDRGGVSLTVAGGRCYRVDAVVLATGNPAPDRNEGVYFGDPWHPDATAGIARNDPVLLIGTGLTMVDTVQSLLCRDHRGTIHAVSRRGLLPQVHAPTKPLEISPQRLPRTTSTAKLAAWLHAAVRHAAKEGHDWRSVIDGLRPHIQDLWRRLPLEERRRFLRHLRPWWDIHRHRMAPLVASDLHAAIDRNQVVIRAGRLQEMIIGTSSATCRIQRRGLRIEETLPVARVINCSGPQTNYARNRDPLIKDMLARGFVRTDPLDVGLDVSEQGALVSSRGVASSRLFAVGPVTRGTFWEIVAVPDIRLHCVRLANHLMTITRQQLSAQKNSAGQPAGVAHPLRLIESPDGLPSASRYGAGHL
jgi:uncharacterized NAD(P)/FAD-binding protein YdhS